MSTDTNSANQLADYLGDGQPLADALRSGDRETIEAIVHRLTDQLELLKQESQMAGLPPLPTSSAVLTGTTASSTSNMAKDTSTDHVHMHRRRLSSIPGIASAKSMARSSTDDLRATKDRRKRATMAPGLLGSEAPRVGLFCAYCGMSLDEGFDMATKATLSSEIGYCCSNCESILSSAIEGEDDEGSGLLQAGAAGATTSGGLLLDGDSISINAVVGDASEGTTRSVGTLQRQQVCDVCHGDLGEEYVNVLGRRFHVTHFCCEDCNIPLYALGGYLQDPAGSDKFYCQRDYLQRFSPSCHACSVQITSGEMVVALGRTYHSDCFVCSICQSPFIGDVCYEHDSQPLCEWHWYIQNGLLCTECGGIIKNQCVLTRGKKYHQTCAESKYGESAISIDEARRQLKGSGVGNSVAKSAIS